TAASVGTRAVGARGGERAARRPGSLAQAVDRVMSAEVSVQPHQPQSAAAPSPFPPIADYAFLSNCHTGALVAADGAIEDLATPTDEDDAFARIDATVRFWRTWLSRARIPDHRFRDPVQRSAL